MWILTITLIAIAKASSNYPLIDKEDLTTSLDSKTQPNSVLEGFYDVIYVQSLMPRSKPDPAHYTSQDDNRYESAKINSVPASAKNQLPQSQSFKQSIIDQIEKDLNLHSSP